MPDRFVLIFIWVFIPLALHSQVMRRPAAAPYIGLGAYSSHSDVFSFTSNQAALAQLPAFAAGIYGERRFLLNELGHYHAVVALPTHSGNFGVKTRYFGFSDYNETQVGLAYARKLGNTGAIGAQFNYNVIKAAGYGKASAVSFEAGTIFHITDKLHTGFHISNPVGGKFGEDQKEKLTSAYTMGFGYDASEIFSLDIEITKEEEQPVNADMGIQYKFSSALWARAGISTAVSSAWFGVGFNLQSFRLDVAAAYHPQLGITPGLLLLFVFNKDKS